MLKLVIKSKTFLRYILTYGIVLLIPMMIFILFIHANIIPQMRVDVIEENQSKTTNFKNQFEKNLKTLDRISANMTMNRILLPFHLEKNYYKKYEGISELKKYHMSNDSTDNIFYYVLGNDNIYTAYNESKLKFFFNSLHNYDKWDEDKFREYASNLRMPEVQTLKETDPDNEYLIYAYPISNYAVSVFLINIDTVKDISKNIFTGQENTFLIFDTNRDLIFSNNQKTKEIIENKNNIIDFSQRDEVDKKIDIGNNSYLISSIVSDKNGLVYISLVEDSILMKDIQKITSSMAIITFLIFLIGSVIIILWSYINYKPIYLMKERLGDSVSLEKKTNEITAINNAVCGIIEDNEELKNTLEKTKPILREHLLRDLILGKNSKDTRMYIGDSELILSENRSYLCLVISSVSGNRIYTDINYEEMGKHIQKNHKDQINFFPINTLNDHQIILVISADDDLFSNKTSLKIVEDMCKKIQKNINETTVAGIGTAYKDLLSIGQSYIEAEYTVQTVGRIDMERSKCKTYCNVIKNDTSIEVKQKYPNVDIDLIIEKLQKGDESAKEIILSILQYISKPKIPRVVARCIVLEMVNYFMELMIEIGISHESNKYKKYMENLSVEIFDNDRTSINKITTTCIEISDEILNYVKKRDAYKNSIVNYVEDNYADDLFSVEKMAEDLNINVTLLCTKYKEYTNNTITFRVWEKRLIKAKELLTNTDMKIKDIIRQVGYYDQSTFTRRFKKETGLTPGEYRKKSKK